MDICTASVSPTGCGHFQITVTVDGVPVSLHVNDTELQEPLTAAERETFVLLSARRLRQRGVTLAQFINRITHGEEATNVKPYDMVGPGAAVTRTNVGTSYVNVHQGSGQPYPIDFTGCTQFWVLADATQVGTGTLGIQLVRDSDNAVLYENAAWGNAGAGEKTLSTGWVDLPPAAQGLFLVRARVKSTTNTDDPIIRRVTVGAR